MTTQEIFGVKVNFGLTKDTFIKKVDEAIRNSSSDYICTVNPEFIMRAKKEQEFKDAINNAYMSVPDGAGVLMANRYLNNVKVKEGSILYRTLSYLLTGLGTGLNSILYKKEYGDRLAGSELIYDICERAEQKEYTIFLLGGWAKTFSGKMLTESGEIAQKTADRLRELYPGIKIVGAESDFRFDEDSDEKSIQLIKNSMAEHSLERLDILMTALPFGEQEKWLARNLHKIPASLGIGLGASFDFILKTQKPAPKIFKSLNLEWLFRLITQPWRYKRVLTAFPAFPFLLYIDSLKKKK